LYPFAAQVTAFQFDVKFVMPTDVAAVVTGADGLFVVNVVVLGNVVL
jgi:hypothetical protein